ncbi:MaoC family dehydratase [Roseateles sp. DC23W]|uniref:MaoC family dehydratase n=1 Tax=Pelomonas dachongensis TaxID=3299029 RepID=A0ABW7EUH5_9BURK
MDTPVADAATTSLVLVGETCERSVRFSREDIATFAQLTGDTNPLHHDVQAAQRARHGEIIASGQQTTAQMIGLVASHFSRSGDGQERELLCLNFNFAFKAPVFAEQELLLHWRVASVEWNHSLDGWLFHADGRATVRNAHPCVIGRGTLLVRKAKGLLTRQE